MPSEVWMNFLTISTATPPPRPEQSDHGARDQRAKSFIQYDYQPIGRLPPRPPPCARPARRRRCEGSSHHGLEKRVLLRALIAVSSVKTASFCVPRLYRSDAPGRTRMIQRN